MGFYFFQIVEDLNLVISIQRKFSYLQSIPGVFAIQRPYLPVQHPCVLKPDNQILESHETTFRLDDKRQLGGGTKRLIDERQDNSPTKTINLGWNSPQNSILAPPLWSLPPLLPTMSCSLGALLSKLPSVVPSYNAPDIALINNTNNTCQKVKADDGGRLGEAQFAKTKAEPSTQSEAAQEEKTSPVRAKVVLQDGAVVEVGFGTLRD